MKKSMIFSAVTAVGLLSAAGQAQVVISQVYGGGGNGGSTYRRDFIELKNTGNTPVNLGGWSVQYASAAGTTWQKTDLTSFTLQPGQYYLVAEAAQGGGTTDLPTPDASGSIAMSATSGKVVLVSSTTLLTGNGFGGPTVVDYVGYGTNATTFEGTGPTPQLSNATAGFRLNTGCQDNNDNAGDFITGPAEPHNSAVTVACGAVFPDVALTFSAPTCGPTLGSSYSVTANLNNAQALPAADTVATFILPPSLNYTGSDTGGVGTTSYNAANRTLTWTIGSFAGSASASLTISGTVTDRAGLTVTGSVATTSPNEPVGNNSAVVYNEAQQTDEPLSVFAIGSFSETSLATSVDEGGFPRQLGTIYRVFTSPNGQWVVFRTDLAGLTGDFNGAVVVGHNVGGTWSFSIVARESTTAPIASLPNNVIDPSTFGNVMGINDAGEYVYSCRTRDPGAAPEATDDVLHWVVVKGTVAGGVSATIKGGNTAQAGNLDADAATAPELAGRNYIVVSSPTIQADGTVSFAATLSGTGATNAAFLKNNGNTVVVQKGVTIPVGSDVPFDFLDDDSGSDGRGFMVSSNGASWLGTGRIDADDATDNVVVVNGTVVVREGSPVTGFTDGATWGTFGSQQLPWAQMESDGHWFVQGYNAATAGFNAGQDWIMRDGTVVARTGAVIAAGETETWADNVLQRTFVVGAGSGDRYVVSGLTNRSTVANGSDDSTDGVVVFNNSQLIVREGTPVEVAPGDIRYLNNINDDRSFIIGDNLYLTATLRSANATCTRNFSNLAQAIVVVPLPGINPPACPADLGIAGGLPGSDGLLDNNDFIAFINYFFNHDTHADVGIAGGFPGSDGMYDNNDFIAFINFFFNGCN